MNRVIKLSSLDLGSINRLNTLSKDNPDINIIVEINSTKGLSSKNLEVLDENIKIRVFGGYDIRKLKVYNFENILEHITYTKEELMLILSSIESIEKEIKPKWSDYQKLVLFYERLKTSIKYDPKYEEKTSREIRTLRGFITKQTVCAGYSLMLKELCDRNNIVCDYVTGVTDKKTGHAWNIITINGRKYPLDLTWDSASFRRGRPSSISFLAQNTKEFRESHIPGPWEKIQNYQDTLSSIDQGYIKTISNEINRELTIFDISDYKRRDGSMFALSQIGSAYINETMYFRYAYFTKDKNGKYIKPIIFYSTTSIKKLDEAFSFGKDIPHNYKDYISNVLFSVENLNDSLNRGTWFIGGLQKKGEQGIKFYESSLLIEKDDDICRNLSYKTSQFTRSDGSTFVLQELTSPKEGKLGKYDMVEFARIDGTNAVKKNTLYSERNLLSDKRVSFIDTFLGRKRIDRKSSTCGGYVGYYDEHGIRMYDEETKEIMNVDQDKPYDQRKVIEDREFPTFEEAKTFVENYNITASDTIDSIKIIEKKTGRIVKKGLEFDKAMWSNIWLSAAGVKWMMDEEISGITYAFNDQASALYEFIENGLRRSCEENGVIDTISLFDNVWFTGNKYGIEVISRLFRSEYQTQFINEYFRKLTKTDKPYIKPITLYNEVYASNLTRNIPKVSL